MCVNLHRKVHRSFLWILQTSMSIPINKVISAPARPVKNYPRSCHKLPTMSPMSEENNSFFKVIIVFGSYTVIPSFVTGTQAPQ